MRDWIKTGVAVQVTDDAEPLLEYLDPITAAFVSGRVGMVMESAPIGFDSGHAFFRVRVSVRETALREDHLAPAGEHPEEVDNEDLRQRRALERWSKKLHG